MTEVSKLAELQKPKLPKHIVEGPEIAWPTIFLTFGCLFGHVFIHYGYNFLGWPYWGCFFGWALMNYWLFTPMHDAAHFAIASHKSGHFWLNDMIGRLAVLPNLVAFQVWRILHLNHHKYTNIDGMDPDYYVHTIPQFFEENPIFQAILTDWRPLILPLKWATQGQYYWYFFLSRRLYKYLLKREQIEVMMTLLVCQATPLYLYLVHNNAYMYHTMQLPSLVSVVLLAFVFDYLPHRNCHSSDPYIGSSLVSVLQVNENQVSPSERSVQKKDEPAENTAAEERVCDPWSLKLMGALCLNQNYHTLHHFYVRIPWYRYTLAWHVYSEYIKSRGTEVIPLLPIFRKPLAKED